MYTIFVFNATLGKRLSLNCQYKIIKGHKAI